MTFQPTLNEQRIILRCPKCVVFSASGRDGPTTRLCKRHAKIAVTRREATA